MKTLPSLQRVAELLDEADEQTKSVADTSNQHQQLFFEYQRDYVSNAMTHVRTLEQQSINIRE